MKNAVDPPGPQVISIAIEDWEAKEEEVVALRKALRFLVDYIEENKRHIPVRMNSKNTGALAHAQEVLSSFEG